jgi:hypothetical protein
MQNKVQELNNYTIIMKQSTEINLIGCDIKEINLVYVKLSDQTISGQFSFLDA